MPRKGQFRETYIGLDQYIVRCLGRFPIPSMEVYYKVSNEYGYIEPRTFYRHLKAMAEKRRINSVEVESPFFHKLDGSLHDSSQPANGYCLRNRNGIKHPVFQRQYIEALKKRNEMIRNISIN